MTHATRPFAAVALAAAVFASAFVTPAPARADAPLADGVPADALLYVGWRGAQHVGDAYDRSRLKVIAEASQITDAMRRIAPQIVQTLADQDPQTAAMADLAFSLGGAVWDYPVAFYLAVPELEANRPPMPQVAVIVHAGDDTERVADAIRQIMDGAPPDVRLATVGDGRVILTNMPAGAIDALNGGPGGGGAALAQHAPFLAALKQTHADPVLAVYFDVEKAVARFDQFVAMEKQRFADAGRPIPDDMEQVLEIREKLAPETVKRFAVAMGFEDRDWSTAAFIESPAAGRKGVSKMMDAAPIDEAALAVIPKNAAMAGASTFDLAETYRQIRQFVAGMDPRMAEEIDEMVAQLEGELEMKIEDDLLEPFGKQWMYYTDADVAGTGLMGVVMINKLDDGAKADKALTRVGEIANAMVNQAIGEEMIQVRIRQTEHAGTTIHYLAIPAIAPSWAIHDGHLYIGLQPQTVAGAVDFTKSGGESFRTSEKYIALRGTLRGGGPLTGFSYVDLPQKVNDAYQVNVLISRYLTGAGELFGIDAPAMAVPPLTVLRPQLAPSMAVSWTDDAGFHVRQRTPFPFADALASEQNLTVASTAMMAGVLLPSLSRAREIANRSKSAANLSGIYKAAYTYSVLNKDKFPDKLSVLVQDGSIGVGQVLHPGEDWRRQTFPVIPINDPKVAEWVEANSSYTWRPGMTANIAADAVVSHESWEVVANHNQDEGMNVLRGDGSVEFMPLWEAVPLIHKSKLPVPEDYKWYLEQ